MPGYIYCALKCFCHPHPQCPKHAPHAWQKPKFGATTQYTPDPDTSPILDAANCTWVQEVIGVLLYCARAVDSTILAALGMLATQQANGTQATIEALTQLLNYCITHPHAIIQYTTSEMDT